MTSIARAPGKIILFGEHFVVHGNRAILGAIDKYVTATSEKNKYRQYSNFFITRTIIDTKKIKIYIKLRKSLEPFFYIAKQVISKNNFDKGISLKIESDIPIGAGLGSSSACCVAAAASILNLFDKSNEREILELSIQAEKTIFPNSSGADCTVSVHGGIIEYQKEKGFSKISIENGLNFLIIDSEQVHATDKVVEQVKKFKEENSNVFLELCSEEERLITKALDSMKNNDLQTIGKCMAQNQIYLEQIGVSNDTLLSITKEIEKNNIWCKNYRSR